MVPPIGWKIFDQWRNEETALEIARNAVEGAMKEITAYAASKGLTDLEAREFRSTAEDNGEGKKTHSFILDLLNSEGNGKYAGYGVLAFCPWSVPLTEAAAQLPDIPGMLGIDLSLDRIRQSLTDFSKSSAESRQKFEKEIEGAIRNPGLEDFKNGNLFVLDEDGLNDLVTEMMNKGGKQKVRNLKIKIDGDQLKISGEYDHWTGWHDFTAVVEFELEDGKASGFVKKIKALGMDLTDDVNGDILKQFQNFGIEPPEGANIKDLSWVQIPGIKRIEIRRDLVILEREPTPAGPA